MPVQASKYNIQEIQGAGCRVLDTGLPKEATLAEDWYRTKLPLNVYLRIQSRKI